MVDFLIRLVGIVATPMISTYHALIFHPTNAMASLIDKVLGTNVFPYLVLGLGMTGTEHELLKKILR